MDLYRLYYLDGRRRKHEFVNRVFATRFQAETWADKWRRANEDHYSEIIADLVPWGERERILLTQQYYTAVPWNDPTWVHLRDAYLSEHFTHVSTEDPTMVAFTPDEEYGKRDRKVRMKPGKYLQKFFGAGKKGVIADGPLKGNLPVLTERQIAFYAEWFEKGSKPRMWSHLDLKFTGRDGMSIVDVYLRGPNSCMDKRHFADPRLHPTQVYGGGDLELAYLEDAEGRAMARALCWPDKKVFGRVYPTPSNYDADGFPSHQEADDCNQELRARLLAMGWTDILSRGNVFDGARLLAVRHPEYGGSEYLMPYLDNGYMFSWGDKDKTHFIMKLGGMFSSSANGRAYVPETFVCACCKREKQRDRRQRYMVVTAYVKGKGFNEPVEWCNDCRYDSTYQWTHPETLETMWVSRKIKRVEMYNHGTWPMEYARERGAYRCQYYDNWFLPSEHKPVKLLGNTYSELAAPNYGFYCAYDNAWYEFDQMSLRWAGFPKKYDALDLPPDVREKSDFTAMVRRCIRKPNGRTEWVYDRKDQSEAAIRWLDAVYMYVVIEGASAVVAMHTLTEEVLAEAVPVEPTAQPAPKPKRTRKPRTVVIPPPVLIAAE